MRLSIIVAMSLNHVIGKNNKMPWHISEDLKRFKAITLGHTVAMGRKTYESLGKPLPGRTNIVLTRDQYFSAQGVIILHSIEELKKYNVKDEEVFVMGGADLYRQFLPLADKIYLTLINKDFEGDVFFPEIDLSKGFQEIERSEEKLNPPDQIPYQFIVLERIKKRN